MISFPWYRLSSDSDLREKIDAQDLLIDDLQRENNALSEEILQLRNSLKKAEAAIASARASLTDWSA